MEHFTVHGPGDVQGDPVVLDDELWEVTVDAYAVDETGRRLYDSAFLSRPKGRDKSGHAGRFVLFEAFGPCRFAGWARGGEKYRWRDFTYRYSKGEPVGRPVTYPFIRCLATEEGQSGNTYDGVHFNLTDGPLAEGLPSNAAGLTRTLLPGGGEIVPSTASNASKDGGKETFCVFDETHLYVLPELRKMYATVRRNMAKRRMAEPWSLETSTMYLPGEGSVAEDTHTLAQQIRERKSRTARLLFDHREGPADVDLADEDQLRQALGEAYGPFAAVMDVDRLIAEIWDPRNSPEDSRRYFLNQAHGAEDSWLVEHEWRPCSAPEKVVADGDAVTLGFDGSKRRSRKVTDATALIACRVSDGHVFEPLEKSVWEQPDGPFGVDWEVPTAQVDAAVDACFARYNVVGFFADPSKWETYIAEWEARYGSRLKVKASQRHPIEVWPKASVMVPAYEQFHTAVVDRQMTHDGAYALTRHILNARRRPGRSGVMIYKEHPDSPRKIDAAVAASYAWKARLEAVAARIGRQPAFVPRRVR
jgi:hypothetical protein